MNILFSPDLNNNYDTWLRCALEITAIETLGEQELQRILRGDWPQSIKIPTPEMPYHPVLNPAGPPVGALTNER